MPTRMDAANGVTTATVRTMNAKTGRRRHRTPSSSGGGRSEDGVATRRVDARCTEVPYPLKPDRNHTERPFPYTGWDRRGDGRGALTERRASRSCANRPQDAAYEG